MGKDIQNNTTPIGIELNGSGSDKISGDYPRFEYDSNCK